MLEIRPNCECCDRDLAPDAVDVWICSFECTWCAECRDRFAEHRCPNCNGLLALRPPRDPGRLVTRPASRRRVFNPDCLAKRLTRHSCRRRGVTDPRAAQLPISLLLI